MASCTSWATITRRTRGRCGGWKSGCGGARGLPAGLIARSPPRPRPAMIPFFVLLAVAGLLFFALVETAFSLLMRLPQRLEAERESESDALARLPRRSAASSSSRARCMRGVLLVVVDRAAGAAGRARA